MNSLIDKARNEASARDIKKRDEEEAARKRLRGVLATTYNEKLQIKYPNEEGEYRATWEDIELVHKSGRHGIGRLIKNDILFFPEYDWDAISGGGMDQRHLWVARHVGIKLNVVDGYPKNLPDEFQEIHSPAQLWDLMSDGWKSFLRRRIPLRCRNCGHDWDWEIPITHHWDSLTSCVECKHRDVTTRYKADPQIRLRNV